MLSAPEGCSRQRGAVQGPFKARQTVFKLDFSLTMSLALKGSNSGKKRFNDTPQGAPARCASGCRHGGPDAKIELWLQSCAFGEKNASVAAMPWSPVLCLPLKLMKY